MQENEVASVNAPPLTLKVVAGPYTDIFGTVLGLRIKSQHGYLVVTFSGCHKHPTVVGPWGS